jgi:regulator of protease activity HflC (stomatin/prohibitin superfamily)
MAARYYEGRVPREGPEQDAFTRFIRIGPPVVLGLLLLYLLWNSFVTVAAHEQAVVLRFGEYHSTEAPGLHLLIPLVDRAYLVDTSEHSMRLVRARGPGRSGSGR